MNNLKKIRENRGYTQEELAKRIGTKQTIYSRYERGYTQLNIELIKKLSLFYNVSADYLIGLSDRERPLR